MTQFLSDNANAATYVQGKYDSTFTEDLYGKITGMPAFDSHANVSTDPLDGKTVY